MHEKLKTFTDQEAYWEAVMSQYKKAKSSSSDGFRLCASGGSSAQIFDQDIDLVETQIWIADERYVSPEHEDSNLKLLIEKVHSRAAIRSWGTDRWDREMCAERYTDKLIEDEEGYIFDLTILGIGPDGHTASLFPGSNALVSQDLTALSQTDVFAVEERLSLTFKAIEKSRHVMVLAMGGNKQEILDLMLDGSQDFKSVPARKLLDFNTSIYFLDL